MTTIVARLLGLPGLDGAEDGPAHDKTAEGNASANEACLKLVRANPVHDIPAMPFDFVYEAADSAFLGGLLRNWLLRCWLLRLLLC